LKNENEHYVPFLEINVILSLLYKHSVNCVCVRRLGDPITVFYTLHSNEYFASYFCVLIVRINTRIFYIFCNVCAARIGL